MAELKDILDLDWYETELPEDFQPIDAIVLVKGVFLKDDGDLTRPVWTQRWTKPLARNVIERIGELTVCRELAIREALEDYDGVERGD